MANISIDNGHSFCTIEEALKAHSIDVWAEYMFDEIREAVAFDIAPCTDEEFMKEYLERSPDDLIIG